MPWTYLRFACLAFGTEVASLPRQLSAHCVCSLYSPANAEAAQLYRENMKEYVRRVRATVEESWLDPEEQEKMDSETTEEAA